MDPISLGRYLKETREAQEIELVDAEERLRIRRGILESFENGNFDVSSNNLQIRGFLRNYATFLGLDSETVLGYYAAAMNQRNKRGWRRGRQKQEESASDTTSTPIAPKKITDTPPITPTVDLDNLYVETDVPPQRGRGIARLLLLLLGTVLGLAVIAFVVMQVLQQNQNSDDSNTTDTAAIFADDLPTRTAAPTRTTLPPTPTVDLPGSQVDWDGDGILVTFEITQRAWLRAIVDGTEEFAGLVAIGELVEYEGEQEIEVTISNGQAFDLAYNGQPQRIFGSRGEEITLRFTPANFSIVATDVNSGGIGSDAEQATVVNPDDVVPTVFATAQIPGDTNNAVVESVSTQEALPTRAADTQQVTSIPTPGPSPTPSDTPIASATSEELIPILAPTDVASEQESVTSENETTASLGAAPTSTNFPTAGPYPSDTPQPTLENSLALEFARIGATLEQDQPTETPEQITPTALQTDEAELTDEPDSDAPATDEAEDESTEEPVSASVPLRVTATTESSE